MRSILLGVLVLVGCTHVDPAERSAEVVATQAKIAPASAVIPSSAALAALTPKNKLEGPGACAGGAACGGACGGSAAAMEGGGCSGGVAELPKWAALPADAQWTELKVTGMHCGGCARRIENQLATVKGVLGVKIDVASAKVVVATAKGVDARGLTKSAIDTLGYSVQ
ncbi:MAG: heavy-metal-associated domain-containing protein [Proteobacteria bacterium]|nr:heavy-metal-associated domain-containing protein [Pseudomonadota bacterium]